MVKVEVQISNTFQRASDNLADLPVFSEAAKNIELVLEFNSTGIQYFCSRFVLKIYTLSATGAFEGFNRKMGTYIIHIDFNPAFNNEWCIRHMRI